MTKFKKVAAGIMSVVMLATGAFSMTAGAVDRNVNEYGLTEEELSNYLSNNGSVFHNGQNIKLSEIENGGLINVEKDGTVEVETKFVGTDGLSFFTFERISYVGGYSWKADNIIIDGKQFSNDDFKLISR